MHRFISAALAATALLTGAGVMAVASPASADTRPCISRTEYRAIKMGMSPAKVASIVGSKGKVAVTSGSGAYSLTIRSWQNCGQMTGMTSNASFMGGRVNAKTGLFW